MKGQTMKAKDMFRELGYEEKIVKGYEGDCKRYWKKKHWNELYIVFYLNNKTVSPFLDCCGEVVPLDLSMEELKAVNQQCKELGWLE